MKNVQKAFLAAVLMLFFLVSAGSALADPNYGLRSVRITSNCSATIPRVPPPPGTATDPNCPGVVPLSASPSSRWSVDISWADPVGHRLYMADRNNNGVDIIDTDTDQVIGVARGFVGIQPTYTPPSPFPNPNPIGFSPVAVANNSGPNGVLVINNSFTHQLWAGDGVLCQNVLNGTTVINVTCTGHSNVVVFDLDANGLPIGAGVPISTGGARRADELAYDPDHQKVLVANDDDLDLFVTFMSVGKTAAQTKVDKKINLFDAVGGIEQPVYDPNTKLFYLAVPATTSNPNGEIKVFDPVKETQVAVFPAPVGCFPHGLALGPRDNLLLGCSGDGPTGSPLISSIMKATTGAILQTFNQPSGPNTQLGGSDEVWYNPGDNHYYLAMSSWTDTGLVGGRATPSLGIIDAGDSDGGASFVQIVPTTRTSHSVAANYIVDCAGNSGNGNGNGNNGNGKGKVKAPNNGNSFGNGNGNGNNCAVVSNKIYLPLTTVPVNSSGITATATVVKNSSGGIDTRFTITEPGGFGVYGQIPAPQNGNSGGGNNGN